MNLRELFEAFCRERHETENDFIILRHVKIKETRGHFIFLVMMDILPAVSWDPSVIRKIANKTPGNLEHIQNMVLLVEQTPGNII